MQQPTPDEPAEAPASEDPDGPPPASGESPGSVEESSDAPEAVPDALSDLPEVPPVAPVEPVRRRRSKQKAERRRAQEAAAGPSLQPPSLPPPSSLSPPLLSGRSLAPQVPKRRLGFVSDHPRLVTGAIVVFAVLAAAVVGKVVAERSADAAMAERSAELAEMLSGATPEEFLAFNAGVNEPGSLAEQARNEDGFVSVEASADRSFIRFQPAGWWSGFTERCLVAVVREDAVTITVPKTACIRVEAPPS